MKRQSALVVFSGGQDSTTCLFWAKEHYETVEAVTFAYGQRHHLEIQVAREIAKEQGIRHHILDMSLLGQITENALTSDMEIEQKRERFPIPSLTVATTSFCPLRQSLLSNEVLKIS